MPFVALRTNISSPALIPVFTARVFVPPRPPLNHRGGQDPLAVSLVE